MENYFTLQDLWVYDLSGNTATAKDRKKAKEYNLLMRTFGTDEWVLIGSWNNILAYVNDYIGVEIVNEYMKPLRKVLSEQERMWHE